MLLHLLPCFLLAPGLLAYEPLEFGFTIRSNPGAGLALNTNSNTSEDCGNCTATVGRLYTAVSWVTAYNLLDIFWQAAVNASDSEFPDFPFTFDECADWALEDNCCGCGGWPDFCGIGKVYRYTCMFKKSYEAILVCELYVGVEFASLDVLVLTINTVLQRLYPPWEVCVGSGYCDGEVTFSP